MARRILPQEIKAFGEELERYYKKHGRDFPWRQTHDPYRIVISEFMLQQTQVSRVMQKYERFLKKFPSVKALARAPLREILHAWQGLGYNRRALYLKRLAEIVVRNYQGILPRDFEALKELPGVGQSTAGAVMAFAFNKPFIFIETNIRRVFIHFFFSGENNVWDDEIKKLIGQTLDAKNPREWYWAVFDYGAMLAERKRSQNPNRRSAHYKKQSKFKGSRRELRGKIIRALIDGQRNISFLARAAGETSERTGVIVRALLKEGMLIKQKQRYAIRERNSTSLRPRNSRANYKENRPT